LAEEFFLGKRVSQKELDDANSRLFSPDEQLLCAIKGKSTRRLNSGQVGKPISGLILVTNKRLLLYRSLFLGRYEHMAFPYDEITTVASRKGYLGDAIDVATASELITIGSISKGDAEPTANIIRDMLTSFKARASSAPVSPQVDIVDQIEKLASLMDKGLVTKEEFEEKKKKLLDKI
jgi:hypothetical protein